LSRFKLFIIRKS